MGIVIIPPHMIQKLITILFCFSLQSMTLEEKVGQLLMVHFRGETPNDDAKTLIQDVCVGGIIYYNWANGLSSPSQVQTLSKGIQALASTPLLIAVDQEGGTMSRFTHGFTKFPGNRELGMIGDPDLTEKTAFAIGQELQALGINMNLAPVVDVDTNPRNPIIGTRSYSHSPETVFIHGERAARGYKQANIIATLKHFPGHGDVAIDSHLDLPVLHKTLEELESCELLPFAKLAPSVDAIMTAHILAPALDEEYCATLSSKTVKYLRDTLGFQGMIISDSLVMKGVLKQCQSIDEAAICALNAGCDMLILGGGGLLELTIADVKRIHRSIADAVKSGRISEERLSQAVEKILNLKEQYGLTPH